jgi:hypothetical protein
VPECCDAELLEVLVREAPKNRFVNLVLAEGRLVLVEPKAPQPSQHVHERPATSGFPPIIIPPRDRVQQGLGVWGDVLHKWPPRASHAASGSQRS